MLSSPKGRKPDKRVYKSTPMLQMSASAPVIWKNHFSFIITKFIRFLNSSFFELKKGFCEIDLDIVFQESVQGQHKMETHKK